MKTLSIVVTGHVQGVFYRDFAVSAAHVAGVTGWVRNRRDGSVEAQATGTEAALATFVAALRQGSPASRVADVEVEATDFDRSTGFAIRETI